MAEQIDLSNKDPHRQRGIILHHHHGFGPIREVGIKEAIWITPGLLIAQNAWLVSHGRPSWALSAPPTMWLDDLDQSLTGRRILTVTAETILAWRRLHRAWGSAPGRSWPSVGYRACLQPGETLKICRASCGRPLRNR